MSLTAEQARDLFRYEPESGLLYWRTTGKGRKLYLGLHEDLELAELVVSEARRKYYGDFAPQFEGC